MDSHIQVCFRGVASSPSLESAVHHWIARLAGQDIEVLGATMIISPAGRRRVTARLALILPDGTTPTAQVAHGDPYVAIAEAFRSVRKQALPRRPLALACAS